MKTCTRCGRAYPPDQTMCPHCGLRLPGWAGLAGAEQADPTPGHIDFLLEQLDEWVRQGWVAPEQARHLYDEYQGRRRHLLAGPPLVEALPQASVPSSSSAPSSSASSPSPSLKLPLTSPVPNRRLSPLSAFFEEKNLSFWQLIGALLLLAGLVGLVRWTWGSIGKYLVFALMLALTGGLLALARSRFVREQRLTRSALIAIGALLLPLDIVAANAFRLLGGGLETIQIGLLTSLLCLPLYGWLARRERGRWPVVLLAADGASAVYFCVQVGLGLARADEWRGLAYGLSYAGLAASFLLAARHEEEERRGLWFSTAYGATVAALAFALWRGAPDIPGALASTLLAIGLAYGVAAAFFEDRAFAFLSLGTGTVGGALALQWAGLGDWAARWYLYLAWVQAVGLASWGASRLLIRRAHEVLPEACRDGGLFLSCLALVVQAVRVVLVLAAFPRLNLAGAQLWEMVLPAVLSLGFFLIVRQGTAAAGLLAYLVVLLELLLAGYAPLHSLPHRQPNLGLFLALAALLLWRIHRPQVSLVTAALGLLVCSAYAALGVFWETTVLALTLLGLVFARQAGTAQALSVWPATAASLLDMLVVERHVLPWAHTYWGWEPNYGLGLLLLSLLGLTLGARLRLSDWTWAALIVGAANVLLQLSYSFTPLPYSPLILLALGAILAAGVGLARRLPRAADCAVGLTGAFYLAFVVEQVSGNAVAGPGREALAGGELLGLALLLAWLAGRQDRPPLVYAAALGGAASMVHGLHCLWHPIPVVYALALWPFAAVLYGGGWALARRAGEVWREPLHTSALLTSLTALLSVTAWTLLGAGQGERVTLIETVCLYGALYGAVAGATQRTSYAGLASAAFSGAYLLALFQQVPSLSSPRLAFLFSLAALVCLTIVQGASRLAFTRFAARALNSSALGIGLVAISLALTGLGYSEGRYAVYTLLIGGTAFLGAAWGLDAPAWGHAGVAAYFLAYSAYLTKRLGTPGLPNSDFYLVPAGFYIITLGLLARRAGRPNPQTYFLTGLLLALTPTFVAAWQPQATPLHALLLLTECVVALFYGIAARVKVFVGAGIGFLVALLMRETQGMVGHIHWAVYATGLGLAILASALFFEKRGDEVRRWARAAQEKLNEWN